VAHLFHRSVTVSQLNASRDSHGGEVFMSKMMLRRKSLAKTFLIVSALFALLEGPYFATFLYFSLGYRIPRNPVAFRMLLEMLQTFRTLINPFVYLTRAHSFKKIITAPVVCVGGDENDSSYGGATSDRRGKGVVSSRRSKRDYSIDSGSNVTSV